MKNKIVVIGGGGHAKVIINTLKKANKYEIIGRTDFKNKGSMLGVKYLGDDNILNIIIKNNICRNAVIGIKTLNVSSLRNQIYHKLKK